MEGASGLGGGRPRGRPRNGGTRDEATTPRSSPGPRPLVGCHLSELGLRMLRRALPRPPLLGEGVASGVSPRSSISMVITTLGARGAPVSPPAATTAAAAPSLPANRYFLSLRDSPAAPLAFFSLAALVLRLWSSIA